MKINKMIFSAVALMGLTAQGAFAAHETIAFDINSGGADMYACNAGIMHNGYTERDSATINVSPWFDLDIITPPSTSTLTAYADGTGTAVEFFKNLITPLVGGPLYVNRITSLKFDLGSDHYGAEYFIDICYRGSLILGERHAPASPPIFVARRHVTPTTPGTYLADNDAGLNLKIETRCHMGSNVTNCTTGSNCPPPLSYNFTAPLVTSAFSTSAITSDINLSPATSNTPRQCYTRYTFSEKTTDANPALMDRPWTVQNATVTTFTEIDVI